jgi:hypothetical protein
MVVIAKVQDMKKFISIAAAVFIVFLIYIQIGQTADQNWGGIKTMLRLMEGEER